METKTTHIQKQRAQFAYNRKQVLWLTAMTNEELNAFQFDTGLDWLQRYTNEQRELLNEIMRQPLIWKWWMLNWNRRDDDVCLRMLYTIEANGRAAYYRSMHQGIFIEQTPAWCLLENSYSKAIGQLNDKLNRERLW